MMFDIFNKQGALNRATYYIHCCSKNKCYFLYCIVAEGGYISDHYFYSCRDTSTLQEVIELYMQELRQYEEPAIIKDFYFQGQLVLTLTPTVDTKAR